MDEAGSDRPLFRDIRRYYCDFCGICRSKKSLIASHILAYHKEELESTMAQSDSDTEESRKSNTCKQCDATFKKPAHLKQHMQSHALEAKDIWVFKPNEFQCEALDTPKCAMAST